LEKPFSAYQGNEPYVFVCYAHGDAEVVYPQIVWLKEQGTNIWYDEGISAGRNWRAVIGEALIGAEHVLFFISRRSADSDHCNREINLAFEEGKSVIPIYLEDVELSADLKLGLARLQALYLNRDDQIRQNLLDVLNQPAKSKQRPPIAERRPTKKPLMGFLLIFAALMTVTGWYLLRPSTEAPAPLQVIDQQQLASDEPMIAVLPFTHPPGDADLDLLSDALTDTVTSELQRLQGLSVISQSSARKFRNSDQDVRDIGNLLSADYIVEGNVRASGDTTRISVSLADTSTGELLWSAYFDKDLSELSNIFSLYDEVSKMLLLQLQNLMDVRLLGFPQSATPTHSLEAYMLWRRALLSLREGKIGTVPPLLEEATTIDPEFARGYALNATAKWIMAENGFTSPEGYLEAREAAQKAIERDPNLGAAYLTLARLTARIDLDFREAMKLTYKAEQSGAPPNMVADFKGELFLNTGRYAEGLVQFQKAEKLDPLDIAAKWQTARMLSRMGRIPEASEKFEQVLTMRTPGQGNTIAYILLHYIDHDLDRAIEIVQEIADPNVVPPWAATLIALKQGDRQPHQALVDRVTQGNDPNASANFIAWGNFRLGNYDEHMRWFAIQVQEMISLLYLHDAMYGIAENYWENLEAWSEEDPDKSEERKAALDEHKALVNQVMDKMVL
jgi:TolB-like protein